MTLKALRPVGNRILAPAPSPVQTQIAEGYHSYLLNSGTAALALAIIAAKIRHPTDHAEVILPTYGCPDLVAATCHAGARAVLVDIQPDSPLYDYEQLRAALTPNTVAIVAATLLGIRPNANPLREIIGARPITLIEDSAQWFPRDVTQNFFGDLVVLSFGRGKPVNVLGGGALLTRTELPDTVTAHIKTAPDSSSSAAKYWVKRTIYNSLINPTLYGLAEKAPFLHIGETLFHELTSISAMSAAIRNLLSANITAYAQRDLTIQRAWRAAIAPIPRCRLDELCATHDVPDDYSLLRYPLLIKTGALRDSIYTRLHQLGLGASVMYARPLSEIPQVTKYADLFSTQHNAEIFSKQLLTLPTHDGVTNRTVIQTLAALKNTPTRPRTRLSEP